MNAEFKPGSRVRCVSSIPFLPITEGKKYTVTEVFDNPNIGPALRLKELPEGSYKVSRFELAQ